MYDKLKVLMEEQNIAFGELANKLGISNKTLNRKCNGLTEWTYKEIIVLTELLKIESPETFFF